MAARGQARSEHEEAVRILRVPDESFLRQRRELNDFRVAFIRVRMVHCVRALYQRVAFEHFATSCGRGYRTVKIEK